MLRCAYGDKPRRSRCEEAHGLKAPVSYQNDAIDPKRILSPSPGEPIML